MSEYGTTLSGESKKKLTEPVKSGDLREIIHDEISLYDYNDVFDFERLEVNLTKRLSQLITEPEKVCCLDCNEEEKLLIKDRQCDEKHDKLIQTRGEYEEI